jgi:hypothetical protein
MPIVRKCPICGIDFNVWDCHANKPGQFRFCSSACRKRNTEAEALKPLTAMRLREIIYYAPDTGEFTWRIPRPGVKAGSMAGTINKDGYVMICVYGRDYPAASVAWLYMTGEWPSGLVDHKDRQPLNNRFENLRDATYHQNNVNKVNRNKTGHQGVRWAKRSKMWEANIFKNGRPTYIGSFRSPEDAGAAYRDAHVKLHGEFSPFFIHEPDLAISSAP